MNITIVTPWYEHLELADDYFEAVLPELQTGDRNLVIDNHSNPPLPFAAYEFSFNAGFSRACNLGLKRAKTDAVLFLNNDIALGEPGWLEMYREALEPGVLCGPLRYGHHADVNGIQLPYIDGWCLAGMKKDLMELGGFDQSLREPAYYSDNLLCLSAREHGMRLRDVRVPLVHKENATAGSSSDPIVAGASAYNRAKYVARALSVLEAA